MTICEPFIRRRAIRHMEKNRVVIFAAGTGNPFFTTDTGAALRAAEMNCDAMLKGTQVDGVYTADPKLDADATRFDTLDYMEVLSKELKVMDATAISLLKENKIPIVVFRIRDKGGARQGADRAGRVDRHRRQEEIGEGAAMPRHSTSRRSRSAWTARSPR